jgi:serine/threonine-protein kinase RsbW
MKMVIQSDLKSARRVEDELLSAVEGCGYDEAERFAIKLALEEAINNAIKHGNKGDPRKTVDVSYDIDGEHAMIIIADEGKGFDPETVPDPTADENLEKPSGRGVMLMRAYMDEVTFNKAGNCVTLVKRKRPGDRPSSKPPG